MPLTNRQRAAIATLEWMNDGLQQRRTGRSLALAVALIRLGCRYPGQEIMVADHAMERNASHHLFNLIGTFLNAEFDDYFRINSQRHTFQILRPITNWEPSEETLMMFGRPPEQVTPQRRMRDRNDLLIEALLDPPYEPDMSERLIQVDAMVARDNARFLGQTAGRLRRRQLGMDDIDADIPIVDISLDDMNPDELANVIREIGEVTIDPPKPPEPEGPSVLERLLADDDL